MQVEIIAAAALFDLSVYYFTHPSTSFKWEAIHPLHHEEKENLVNLFTLSASQLPLINRPLTHVELLYKENVHYNSIIDDETGYPWND